MNAASSKDENIGIAYGMGLTAEKVAEHWKITREAQDAFSLKSHQKAIAAQQAGEFKDEIDARSKSSSVSPTSPPAKSTSRPAASATTKARAPTPTSKAWRSCGRCSRHKGSVTAGNSSQTSDGAGALIVCQRKDPEAVQPDAARALRVVSRCAACRRKSWASVRRKRFRRRCKAAGITQDEIDWIELNEAFAAQSLAVIQDLGLDPPKVNPMGGAIALGHPLGATGAIRSATVVHALRRHNLKYGMVTMCVGTGMGAAGIFERV